MPTLLRCALALRSHAIDYVTEWRVTAVGVNLDVSSYSGFRYQAHTVVPDLIGRTSSVRLTNTCCCTLLGKLLVHTRNALTTGHLQLSSSIHSLRAAPFALPRVRVVFYEYES